MSRIKAKTLNRFASIRLFIRARRVSGARSARLGRATLAGVKRTRAYVSAQIALSGINFGDACKRRARLNARERQHARDDSQA